MSINDDILSRELKHRALLSLYEKKLDTDLTKVMSSHKKRLVNSTLKNGMKGSNALNRALGVETRKTYRRIYREGIKELKALAKIDSRFQASTLNKSFGKIYRSKVYTGLKVNDLIINSSGTYGQQIASISLGQQRRIKQIVKEGMIDNLAVNKIADNIGKTVDLPKAQLRTLSRTAITETSTNINNATYKLNEDVIDGYQYVATLDSRTSLICANLDGKVFRLGDKRGVRPPQHFNCRSTTIPIVKSHEDLMNTKSSRISKRRLSRVRSGKRASFNGQVPAKTNFEEFFKQQDDSFKLAVLGSKERVDIFNTGKLKFSQFSTRDGKLVSVARLDELLNGVKAKPVVKPKPKVKDVGDVDVGSKIPNASNELIEEYNKEFNAQLTKQQKVIVGKYEKPSTIKHRYDTIDDGGAYYSGDKRLIAQMNDTDRGAGVTGKVKGYVMSHEYGHHIDYVSNNSRYVAWSQVNLEYLDAIALDRKAFMGRKKNIAMENFKKKIAVVKARKLSFTTIDENYLLLDGGGEISDILDAFTKGYFRKNYSMWGHRVSYWKRNGAVPKEIFANMFALYHDKKAWKLVEELAPETSKVFVKRLNELEKIKLD